MHQWIGKESEDIMAETRESEITKIGNPRKPQGKAGEEMLQRMNESHYEVTGWALEHFQWNEKDQVLDIGCGGGETLHRMAGHVPQGHLTGADYSATSVKMSKERNKDLIEQGKMEIIEASVEKLPFEAEAFDKIITVESFYFWPEPLENLKEVRRVLKKNGTFLLVADIYQKEGLPEHALENIKRYDLFNPTKEQFYELFRSAGFTQAQVHTKPGTDWICVEGKC